MTDTEPAVIVVDATNITNDNATDAAQPVQPALTASPTTTTTTQNNEPHKKTESTTSPQWEPLNGDSSNISPMSSNPAKRVDSFKMKPDEKVGGKWHVNAMGQIIYKKHESYTLMLQIQMGIRTTISEITPKKRKELKLVDMSNVLKVDFPSEGSLSTPAHNYPSFVFYDYAPFPFRYLRERFNIEAPHFLVWKKNCTNYFLRMPFVMTNHWPFWVRRASLVRSSCSPWTYVSFSIYITILDAIYFENDYQARI